MSSRRPEAAWRYNPTCRCRRQRTTQRRYDSVVDYLHPLSSQATAWGRDSDQVQWTRMILIDCFTWNMTYPQVIHRLLTVDVDNSQLGCARMGALDPAGLLVEVAW